MGPDPIAAGFHIEEEAVILVSVEREVVVESGLSGDGLRWEFAVEGSLGAFGEVTFLDDEGGDFRVGFCECGELRDEVGVGFLFDIEGEEKDGGEPVDGNVLEAREVSAPAVEEASAFGAEGGGEGGEHLWWRLAGAFIVGKSPFRIVDMPGRWPAVCRRIMEVAILSDSSLRAEITFRIQDSILKQITQFRTFTQHVAPPFLPPPPLYGSSAGRHDFHCSYGPCGGTHGGHFFLYRRVSCSDFCGEVFMESARQGHSGNPSYQLSKSAVSYVGERTFHVCHSHDDLGRA